MSKRYITLGCGRQIGLGTYVKAWKTCLELPAGAFIGKGVSGWGQTAAEALQDLRKGMDDRINRNIPGYGIGRKWDPDWYFLIWRASRDLNQPRLLIRYLPPDLMKIPRFLERVEYARAA
jgi:hypothetical protein